MRFVTTALFLLISVSLGSAQKATFAVGEKASGSVGFYSANWQRLGGAKVGIHPHELALSSDGKTIYTSDNGVMLMTETGPGENTVSIVDIASRTRTGVIDLGEYRRPHGITFDDHTGKVLVTTEKPSALLVLDPGRKAVQRKIDVQGKAPHWVMLGTNDEWAYTSNTDTGTVSAIRLSDAFTKVMPCGERPQGAAFSPDRKTLYVANSAGVSITIFDVVKNERTGSIATGKAPVRVAVTPDGKTLVYALQDGQAVGFADVASRKEIGQVPVGGRTVSMTLSEDGQTAYSSVQDQDKIFVISVPQRKLIRTVSLAKGTGPDPVLLLP